MDYFRKSLAYFHNCNTEKYIIKCRRILGLDKTLQNSNKISEKPYINLLDENLNEKDQECLKIINYNNNYDILGLKNSANQNEIKKAYKKVSFLIKLKS